MNTDILIAALVLISAYLLGSLPFGIFVSWFFGLQDPRKAGSQNMGATNILRSGHKGAAFLTLLLDIFKGSAAVLGASFLAPSLLQGAGLCAVMGHIWPLWLRFRGGKGVATAFGVILILSPPVALVCCVTWLSVAIATRYASLASLISVMLSPLYAVLLKQTDVVLTCLVLALLLVWTHRQNISRLITGKETKIGENTPP
jgi:glycerol-3-phosphate acyltransferase PlsY